jgi:hypothetical protein
MGGAEIDRCESGNFDFTVHKWLNLCLSTGRFHSKSSGITSKNIISVNGTFRDPSNVKIFPDYTFNLTDFIMLINSSSVNSGSGS